VNRDDVAKRLRLARPVKLRVVLNDETEKPVTMPRGRQRFDKAAGIIDAMPWATVYMLDAQASIIAEPINRDDSSPAADLEDVPKNPTMAIVHGVISGLGSVLRDVHKAATASATELVIKIRATHKDEMATILAGYNALLEKTLDRNVAFEERSNQLMIENDELRERIAEMQRTAKADNGNEEWREKMLAKALGMPVDEMPSGGQPEGTGANGAG
jgi:hypothetical protein